MENTATNPTHSSTSSNSNPAQLQPEALPQDTTQNQPVHQAQVTHSPVDKVIQTPHNETSFGTTNPQSTVPLYTTKTNVSTSMKKIKPQFLAVISALVIVAGIATGYGGYQLQAKNTHSSDSMSKSGELQQVAQGKVNNGDVFGVPDEKTFKDKAEGYLEAGGLDGEGSHKLLRPGGESQTVYLTSSVTDLNDFVGMEVKIWGETNKGQKAGWLMDVGRIEVVNTAGNKPATK